MDTTSYWIDSVSRPESSKPAGDLKVDVVVIGGGITGITTAYLMKRTGLTVALIERERFAQIDTGHTTAHITSVTDLRLHEMVGTYRRLEEKLLSFAPQARVDHRWSGAGD